MRNPAGASNRVAYFLTKMFRWFADIFFAKRYGHSAVVLETVAGVPEMVARKRNHLRSLRKMQPDDRGWIKTLLEEAENERMHLMIFREIAHSNWFERRVILLAQFVFWHFYFILFVFFQKTAHRMVGYFEDQVIVSDTQYLEEIKKGNTPNITAPRIAINYYNLSENATLKDVVIAVRADEQGHADANHGMAATVKWFCAVFFQGWQRPCHQSTASK